jgi:2-oxo-4-hydroxy-4-carboxy--5-ureidoimidazoline (OHCU) decarboxylase
VECEFHLVSISLVTGSVSVPTARVITFPRNSLARNASVISAWSSNFLLRKHFRAATEEDRLQVLTAYLDLAGKLAQAKRLTAHSTDERVLFTDLNQMYTKKFAFPFIIAVKDQTKEGIL